MKNTFLCMLLLGSNIVFASDFNEDTEWSLYNVSTGSLLSVDPWQFNIDNSYLFNITAYYLDKDYQIDFPNEPEHTKPYWLSWWKIKETVLGSGKYYIQNYLTHKCVAYYKNNKRVVQKKCDIHDKNQLWKIDLGEAPSNNKSFRIVSLAHPDDCMYGWPGDKNFYTYSGSCSYYSNLSDWTIIPVFRRGYYHPG